MNFIITGASLPNLFSPLTMSQTRLLPRLLTHPSILTRSPIPFASATITKRAFSQSVTRFAKDPKMPPGPPKHEMAYFPEMTSALPSTSGEFRRVLWTGLYSQVVLMTVPVGGDIGDEVSSCLFIALFLFHSWISETDSSLAGSHRRPSLDLHIRSRQSHHCWQGSGCQSWRPYGSAGWDSASICQHWSYATSRLALPT